MGRATQGKLRSHTNDGGGGCQAAGQVMAGALRALGGAVFACLVGVGPAPAAGHSVTGNKMRARLRGLCEARVKQSPASGELRKQVRCPGCSAAVLGPELRGSAQSACPRPRAPGGTESMLCALLSGRVENLSGSADV